MVSGENSCLRIDFVMEYFFYYILQANLAGVVCDSKWLLFANIRLMINERNCSFLLEYLYRVIDLQDYRRIKDEFQKIPTVRLVANRHIVL